MQKLSTTAVQQAKPKPKPYKLADGGGFYLLANAKGKYLRYDHRFAAKPTNDRSLLPVFQPTDTAS